MGSVREVRVVFEFRGRNGSLPESSLDALNAEGTETQPLNSEPMTL